MAYLEVLGVPGTHVDEHPNLKKLEFNRVQWGDPKTGVYSSVDGARSFSAEDRKDRDLFKQMGGMLIPPSCLEYGDAENPDRVTGHVWGVVMPPDTIVSRE